MNKLTTIAATILMASSSYGAESITVPIAKVDMLSLNDAAKSNDTKRIAEGVGVVGRVWGYVKDGVIYMASSTKEAVVEHPYITAGSIAAAVLADRNNNWSGLWKKGSDTPAGSSSTSGDSTTLINDNSIAVTANEGSTVTIYSNRDSDNGKE
jgi:hypothetical protein